MQLGIVAALPVEARCLLGRRAKPGERASLGNTAWVQLSGMGPENARRAAQSLLVSGATALVSWGVAAGLAPQLHRGHLVLPKAVLTADGQILLIDEAWHARVYAAVSKFTETSTGNLAETLTALSTPSEKAALMQRNGAVAADMESAAVGAVAQQAGVPFLVVRSVLDGFAASLPAAAMAAMDMSGKFHALRWFKAILQRPAQITDMLPLALGLRAATKTLVRVADLTGLSLKTQAPLAW